MQSVTGDGVNRQVATQFANAHLFTEQQGDETCLTQKRQRETKLKRSHETVSRQYFRDKRNAKCNG